MAFIVGGRSNYSKGKLEIDDLSSNPFENLEQWLLAAEAAGVQEPSAMCLSTVSADGKPSSRFVLLRGLDHGLKFYTNYESRKGAELSANEFACIAFWWAAMERQVRVEGRVEKLSAQESDAYFLSRPAESQRASAASPQSQVVSSREALDQMIEEYQLGGRPENWGGYRLVPTRFEFWQGRSNRAHDRFVFETDQEGGWKIERLAP